MSQIKGADVSQFNDVSMARLKSDGLEFVSIRSSYGGGGLDGKFKQYWPAAKAAGLIRQAYHFAYPGRSTGAQQAADFVNAINAAGGIQPGDSFALDMEDEPVYGRSLVASDVGWAKEFLDTFQKLTGIKALIYLNTSLKSRFDWSPIKNADYGLWHANYGVNNGQPGTEPNPAPWPFNAMWQYTSKGSAGGTSPLDLDIFNGNRDQLLKYGASGAVTPSPAPAPTPTPQPAAPSATQTYVVKPGDFLSTIAPRFGTTWQALASLNRIADPNKIYAGQVIQVPASGGYRTYTVKSGDVLSRIAPALGVTQAHLVSLNGIANPDRIYAGQVLKY